MPGPKPNMARPRGLMIELQNAIGDHVRVVIRHGNHAGADLDPRCTLSRRGDEQIRRAIDLHAAGMVLAHPNLGEAEMLEPFHEFEIAPHAQGDVFVIAVVGRQEHACAQIASFVTHATSPLFHHRCRSFLSAAAAEDNIFIAD